MMMNFEDIINSAKKRGRKRMVMPCIDLYRSSISAPEDQGYSDSDEKSILKTVMTAAEAGLIEPILIGEERRIKEKLVSLEIPEEKTEIIGEKEEIKVVNRAIQMIHDGDADLLMRGMTKTREFLGAISDKDGLMKNNFLSYVSLFELKDRLMLLTDTYINDFPDLSMKIAIAENSIELAETFGIEKTKIAALSSIEYVNPAIPSTVDAAVISKMSERGQIDAVIEGPLDIDAASSKIAAKRKGIDAAVPEEANVFLFPDIESAYAFSQFLIFLFGVEMTGTLMGTRSPVILNIGIGTPKSRVLEIALGVLRC